MRPILALIIASLTVLAGCVGDDDPVDEATTSAAADPPASATTPASAATDAVDNATAEPVPIAVPFTFDGTLANYAEACQFGQTGGQCVSSPTGSTTRSVDLVRQGNLSAFHIEITWSAATPATAQMGAHLYRCHTDLEESTTTCEGLSMVEGASPLVLEASGLSIPPEDEIGIFVFRPQPQPQAEPVGVSTYAELEQAFHAEGTVTELR